jgi:hypothetical protein
MKIEPHNPDISARRLLPTQAAASSAEPPPPNRVVILNVQIFGLAGLPVRHLIADNCLNGHSCDYMQRRNACLPGQKILC